MIVTRYGIKDSDGLACEYYKLEDDALNDLDRWSAILDDDCTLWKCEGYLQEFDGLSGSSMTVFMEETNEKIEVLKDDD